MTQLNLYLCSMAIILIILAKHFAYGQNQIQTTSPCPNIFQHSGPEKGEINLPNPGGVEEILLKVEYIVFGRLLANDRGTLTLTRPNQQSLKRILESGRDINYKIRFPSVTSNYLPQIIRIYYNDNIICSGTTDDDISGPRSTIRLQKRNYVIKNTNDNDNENSYEPKQRPTIRTTTSQRPFTPSTIKQKTTVSSLPRTEDNGICGVVDSRFQFTPLVIGGDAIRYGSWPWLAAIYVSEAKSLRYQCGGSLVSNRVVVSAAHCFVSGTRPYLPVDIIVYLGRHNLNNWNEIGQQQREVALVKLHNDYLQSEPNTFEADIAVLVLRRTVEYSLYIRPICLWSDSKELRHVVGKMGTVVGWGLTELGVSQSEPRIIEIPIVSQENCLLLSPKSFKQITSERTFCAGSRQGTGPCNGDSGSGLAIKQNNKWVLRGIVSVSASIDVVNRKCDLSKFVVFADAAKFDDFIEEFIN